jgi:hypothetical protein
MDPTSGTNGGIAPSAFLHKQLDITLGFVAVDSGDSPEYTTAPWADPSAENFVGVSPESIAQCVAPTNSGMSSLHHLLSHFTPCGLGDGPISRAFSWHFNKALGMTLSKPSQYEA